jgi:hypothetical protein
MSWDALTAIATVALAFAVPFTIWFGWKGTNSTLKEERYAQYATRYQEIFSNLPYNIFVEGNTKTPVDEKTKTWLVTYVDLCWEELLNHNRGKIPKDVWDDWEKVIVNNFKRSSPLRGVFTEVKADYNQLNDFLKKKGALIEETKVDSPKNSGEKTSS